jgi:hypothetical protein
MKSNAILYLCLLFGVLASWNGTAMAADKADPNGTWKWTFTPPGQDGIDVSAELKLEDQRLTGKVVAGDRSFDVSDGTFVGDEVAFNVVAENDGLKITAKFKGKLEGDSINGKTEIELNGETLSFDWNATRQK